MPSSPRTRAAAGACSQRSRNHRTDEIPRTMVPGCLNQQPAGVGIAGLGDRPLHPRRSRRALAGNQPDERANTVAGKPIPITDLHAQRKRGQRTDSTQARHPPHNRCELAITGHLGDRHIQPVTSSFHRQHVFIIGIEGHLCGHPGQRRRCDCPQPSIMRAGPGRPTVVHHAVAQQQLRKPVTCPHQIAPAVFAGPDQIRAPLPAPQSGSTPRWSRPAVVISPGGSRRAHRS